MNIIEKIMNDLGWYRKSKKKKKRICFVCQLQIKRNHKWYIAIGGKRHINCNNPTLTNDVPPTNEVQEKLEL